MSESQAVSYVEWAEARLPRDFEVGVPDIAVALRLDEKTVTALIESGAFYPHARLKNPGENTKRRRFVVQRAAIIEWVRRNQH